MMRSPVFYSSPLPIIEFIIYFRLCAEMNRLKGIFYFSAVSKSSPSVSFLKKLYIAAVPPSTLSAAGFYMPGVSEDSLEDLLPPLIMFRNSGNSIIFEPSSSTAVTNYVTYDLFSTKPRAIKGSSSSSTPIASEPSSSRELKHVLRSRRAESEKSMQCSFPRFLSHLRWFDSG